MAIVKEKLIDVSRYNIVKDWQAVKNSGIDGVIIRAIGGSRNFSSYIERLDPKFDPYAKGALGAGLKVGAYLFARAINKQEAEKEIDFFLKALYGYQGLLKLPVYYDIEMTGAGNGMLDNLATLYGAGSPRYRQIVNDCFDLFCTKVRAAGFFPGIYGGGPRGGNSFAIPVILTEKSRPYERGRTDFSTWVADYGSSGYLPTDYYGENGHHKTDIWQYTSKGNVNGIVNQYGYPVTCDCNYLYIEDSSSGGQTTNIDNNIVEADQNVQTSFHQICGPDKIIQIAMGEIGYLEKASNNYLDNYTANAGSNNYTKYARDLYGYNGFPWCATFVDWCFWVLCNRKRSEAKKLKPFSASCYCTRILLRKGEQQGKGYFYRQRQNYSPQKGDQIFFDGHTGLVYEVDESYVYTIEGNAGNRVQTKKYLKNSYDILGYGHPNWGSAVYDSDYAGDVIIIEDPPKHLYSIKKEDGTSLNPSQEFDIFERALEKYNELINKPIDENIFIFQEDSICYPIILEEIYQIQNINSGEIKTTKYENYNEAFEFYNSIEQKERKNWQITTIWGDILYPNAIKNNFKTINIEKILNTTNLKILPI